jgi:16S rRNA (cytidine1402-2'-O)-methyltransferase
MTESSPSSATAPFPKNPTGILYVVSTPIGNLEDLTLRALRILKTVDVIAAEDTRHTKQLCTHFGIETSLTSYHDFNKEEKSALLLQRLKSGMSVAVVSDAGTPTVSDPGYFLITQCIASRVPVVPVPGASAVLAALAASGLPTDAFHFEGFLPRKAGLRLKRIESLREQHATLIFFESPYRIQNLLAALYEGLGDRRAVVGRELTKRFEEFQRGTLLELAEQIRNRTPKGELTVVVEGNPRRRRSKRIEQEHAT